MAVQFWSPLIFIFFMRVFFKHWAPSDFHFLFEKGEGYSKFYDFKFLNPNSLKPYLYGIGICLRYFLVQSSIIYKDIFYPDFNISQGSKCYMTWVWHVFKRFKRKSQKLPYNLYSKTQSNVWCHSMHFLIPRRYNFDNFKIIANLCLLFPFLEKPGGWGLSLYHCCSVCVLVILSQLNFSYFFGYSWKIDLELAL